MAPNGSSTSAGPTARCSLSFWPKHPDTGGVVFDLRHVVADAAKSIAERGLADRVSCVGGDFFESVPEGDVRETPAPISVIRAMVDR